MSTSDKTSSNNKTRTPRQSKQEHSQSFLHRIDVRFPWLKLVAVIIIGGIAILDLMNFTISKTNDAYDRIKIAPMSQHVKATERVLYGKMLVALTFDDGPSPDTTPTLLDILYQKDVPATFFMLGNMAKNNPDIVLRADREGHEIASHTMYHQNLIRISPSAAQSDINEAKSVFNNILGHTPSLTRPPYGNINDNVRSSIGTPLILWSVDTLDWKNKNTDSILQTTLSQVHDGAIILMHDIHPTSVEAVTTVIDALRSANYEFVTVSELAEIRHADLKSGSSYYNFRP
ncbi:MAG: polysaccharide deacetylase family protein [Kiritimatiellae bacterium]|nr:polysaccharide deacetylase family protein [Kiritimatiellia bacterium]MBQ2660656.1 polysaccharide deacetylase family protein [Candidatus Saccharibacteria bacterium]